MLVNPEANILADCPALAEFWVAGKELDSSYQDKEI